MTARVELLIYQRVSFVRGMNIHKSQLFWCKQNFDAELVGFDLSPSENLFGRHSLLGDPPKMHLGLINHQQINHQQSMGDLQDPKLEVLYHIRPYFAGIFPYIGLI